ncbi:hypothetical protein DFH94DRAFT_719932 [Russula ochroleuca]|uniref:Uncharacterized protein n=1 Tax=Russula ochroleuca TaxID=152965 RepID=A0A9P5TD86_9AGAM|nr:hypothetical protein DFH94DRAFT_719932 [Russula ochroleuca]
MVRCLWTLTYLQICSDAIEFSLLAALFVDDKSERGLLRARRAPIIHVFVPSRNSLVERGTIFGHAFHVWNACPAGGLVCASVLQFFSLSPIRPWEREVRG